METTHTPSPYPTQTEVNRPFFDGLQEGKFLLQFCSETGKTWFPPSAQSPYTLTKEYEWREASGKGKVWSWIVMHQGYFKEFRERLPYVVAYIQLEEGPLLFSQLEATGADEIHCDMPVEVCFSNDGDGNVVYKFRKAS